MIIQLSFAFLLTVIALMFIVKFLNFGPDQSEYDERTQKIGNEVFTTTLTYLIVFWIFSLIMKTIDFKNISFDYLNEYPELINLALATILIIFNYIRINKKYSV
ncbi:hypothetical protein [Macrococcoides caseolyticum]|uniref:hypothetical protein n=1 Tax=Macrococcoides caseolyticum TaxID=69966 RepID=UPI001F2E66F1|nr:hypothetical protein [Macrococcus caseolyticus]MCE4956075.1 hypothetical protein [Macrococcus caseolyticus]